MEERIGRGSLRRSILEREDLEKHVSPDCSLTRNSLLLYLLEALEGAITRAKEGIRDDKEEGSGWLRARVEDRSILLSLLRCYITRGV